MHTLALRYQDVLDRIDRAARRAGRSASEVTLVAVSKTFPIELVRDLHALGHVDFGENKAQELVAKATELPGRTAGGTVRWHAIGHLQRNKARDVVAHAELFHALDSDRLAAELDRRCAQAERRLACLVQVNISGEDTKSGLEPSQLPAFLDAVDRFEHLEIQGLMTLAAPADDPEDVRPQFRAMRALLDTCGAAGGRPALRLLSMGMSGDYEVAIEEGATHVRVGSAIFGERPQP